MFNTIICGNHAIFGDATVAAALVSKLNLDDANEGWSYTVKSIAFDNFVIEVKDEEGIVVGLL